MVLNGTDLILSIVGVAMGYATNCTITTTAETGERLTKESPDGLWPEKYVTKMSESISADGITLTGGSDKLPSYDQLRDKMMAKEPIEASYSVREGDTREGKTAGGYTGKYLITSLELSGQAGQDSTYTIQMESSGKVTKTGSGLTETAA